MQMKNLNHFYDKRDTQLYLTRINKGNAEMEQGWEETIQRENKSNKQNNSSISLVIMNIKKDVICWCMKTNND